MMLSYSGLNTIYLYNTGQVTSAIDLCLKQLALDDHDFWVYDYLGWAYLGKGEYELAGESFEKALQHNTDPYLEYLGVGRPYKIDLYRLAHSLRLQKRYAEALAVLGRVKEIYSSDMTVEYQMGIICQLMNDPAAAQDHFMNYRSFLKGQMPPADPNETEIYIQLALVSQRMELFEEAQSAFQKAIAIDPDQHFGSALFYSVQNKADEALQNLQLAIQKGWSNYVWIKVHPDLQNLYGHPRFEALLKEHLH
jgi:tetratricopeptide (TPR) repeat protein